MLADVTDTNACRELIDACVSAFNRVDILFNNVGGSAPGGPVEMSEAVWQQQIDQNLNHVFYMCKHTLPIMEHQRQGVIINMGSVAGQRYIGYPHIAYSATKAAVIQASRAIGVQYAAKGIRCNTIVPGLMHTPLVEARLANQRNDGDVQSIIEERNKAVPMGKMGDAWDVANAAVFLASDEAKYITATEIVVDGGLTASI
jgi:NAD(P)-dependent dehydrogenase (short-subunit alcohol dehydrogenase family)